MPVSTRVSLDVAIETARPVLDVLRRRGAPNYFGRQRFGTKGDSHIVGRNIIQNLDFSCFLIHFHFNAMRTKGIGYRHIAFKVPTHVFIGRIIKIICHEHGTAG